METHDTGIKCKKMQRGNPMNINQIMDAAKAKTGSDGKTAKALGLTRAGASAVRHHGNISNEVAQKLAEIVGCSPLDVIAAAEIAKHPERAESWRKWTGSAAILAVGIIVFSSLNTKAYAEFNEITKYTLCAVAIRLLAQWMLYAWTLTTCAAKRV